MGYMQILLLEVVDILNLYYKNYLVSEKDSGLKDALKKLNKVNDIGFIELSEKDVVRHDLVKKIINAYEKHKS